MNTTPGPREPAAQRLHPTPLARLEHSDVHYRLHHHVAIHGAGDNQLAGLPLEHGVKTLAFETAPREDGTAATLVLAAVPEHSRITYGPLARALGVSRSRLRPADPASLETVGMTAGGVSPILPVSPTSPSDRARVVIDDAVLELPVIYCGSGDPATTVELTPEALRALCKDAIIASIAAPTT